MANSEYIKTATKELFRKAHSMPENKRQEIYHNIFNMNYPLVLNEAKKWKSRVSANFFQNNVDDFQQAMSIALWVAIQKYDPDNKEGASLATYAGFFFKGESSDLVRDILFQGTMNNGGYAALKKLEALINNAKMADGTVDTLQLIQSVEESGFKLDTIESVADRAYSLNEYVPVDNVTPLDEGSELSIEKYMSKIENDRIQLDLYNMMADDMEVEMLEYLLNGLEKEDIKAFREKHKINNAEAEYYRNRVVTRLKKYYLAQYHHMPEEEKIYKIKEKSREDRLIDALNKISASMPDVEEIRREEVKEEMQMPTPSLENLGAFNDEVIDSIAESELHAHIRNRVLEKLANIKQDEIRKIVRETLKDIQNIA